MRNIDDISVDLPAPRDDEPESLRSDIVDELADHLESAFQRELHREPDERKANRSVLSRFGNPSTIAPKLWFDAMKEKIMNQRLTMTVLVVLVLMSAGMLVISWQSLGANREMVRESHELNRELVAELRNLGAAAPTRPAEWNRLQVRCVFDTEEGPPAEGIRISMSGRSERTKEIPVALEISGKDGIVDFGLVLYGEYEISATAATGETHERTVSVRPGMDKTETIVCPSLPAGATTASLKVILPESVSIPEEMRERMWLYCSIFNTGRDVSDDHWYPLSEDQNRWILVSAADGQVIESEQVMYDTLPDDFQTFGSRPNTPVDTFLVADASTTSSIDCVTGEYRVNAFLTVEGLEDSSDSNMRYFSNIRFPLQLVESQPSFTAADESNLWTIEVDSFGFADQLAEFASTD